MNPTDPNPDYRPTRYEWDYWEDLSGFGFRKVAFNFGLGYPF